MERTTPEESITGHATKIIEAVLQSGHRIFYNFGRLINSQRTLRENAAVPAGLRRPLPNSRGTNHCTASWLADKGSLRAYSKRLAHNRFRFLAIETTIAPKAFDRKPGSSVGASVGNSKQLVQRADTYCAFS